MKTIQSLSLPLQPKTIVLALSTLFLAGSLSAQSTTQGTQEKRDGASSERLQPRPLCTKNTFKDFHFRQQHKRHAFHRQTGRLSQSLNLTLEQQTELKAVANTFFAKQVVLASELEKNQTELNSALYSAQLDKAAIAKLQEQKNELNEELIGLTDKARIQALEILTAEQRTALGQLAAKWQEFHKPRVFGSPSSRQGHFEWLLLPVNTFASMR